MFDDVTASISVVNHNWTTSLKRRCQKQTWKPQGNNLRRGIKAYTVETIKNIYLE
jgi:hypothetical protein